MAVLSLLLLSCEKEEAPDQIYTYFPDKAYTLKENAEEAVTIPVKVFALENLQHELELTYTITGAGADRVQDQSGGKIQIEKGYKAYIQHIRLLPKNNTEADGDAELTIEMKSPDPKVRIGLGAGKTNSTLKLNVIDDEVSCLTALWSGELKCSDNVYPSYSPSGCTGQEVSEDCQSLKIKFNFWDDGNLPVALSLQLGDLDPATNQGAVTLLQDYNKVGSGYNITFYKGEAGTYDAATGELKLALTFSGYDIGGDGKYRFTIKK